MFTRDDLVRLEKVNDALFDKGILVGGVIKKGAMKVAKVIAVIAIIVFIGSLMFIAGMFSGKKEEGLVSLDNK